MKTNWTYNKDRTLRTRKGAKGQVILHRNEGSAAERWLPYDKTICTIASNGEFCSVCSYERDAALAWATRRLSKKGRKPEPVVSEPTGC